MRPSLEILSAFVAFWNDLIRAGVEQRLHRGGEVVFRVPLTESRRDSRGPVENPKSTQGFFSFTGTAPA